MNINCRALEASRCDRRKATLIINGYSSEAGIPKTNDPMDYWIKKREPELFEIAPIHLLNPGSSVSSERAASALNQIVISRQGRIRDD